MDTRPINNDQALEPEQAAAKAAILAECTQLEVAGVTFVAVHFDGSCDDGTTEEIKCYRSETYAYYEEHEAVPYDASGLQEHFEALVPYGYENGCGGFGDVILNVKARTIPVERKDRFEDYRPAATRSSHGSSTQARPEQRQKIWRKAEDYLPIHNWFDESMRESLWGRRYEQRRCANSCPLHRRTTSEGRSGAHTHYARLVNHKSSPLAGCMVDVLSRTIQARIADRIHSTKY